MLKQNLKQWKINCVSKVDSYANRFNIYSIKLFSEFNIGNEMLGLY